MKHNPLLYHLNSLHCDAIRPINGSALYTLGYSEFAWHGAFSFTILYFLMHGRGLMFIRKGSQGYNFHYL